MIITQGRRLRNLPLIGTVRGHLGCCAISAAGHKLLSLGAPRCTGNLIAKHRSILPRDETSLLEVGHQQVAISGDNGAEGRKFRHGIRDELPDGLARCAQLKRRLGRTLAESLHLIDSKTPTRFSRHEEELLIGTKGQLGYAGRHRHRHLRLEWADVAVTLWGLEGFPYSLCRGNV